MGDEKPMSGSSRPLTVFGCLRILGRRAPTAVGNSSYKAVLGLSHLALEGCIG